MGKNVCKQKKHREQHVNKEPTQVQGCEASGNLHQKDTEFSQSFGGIWDFGKDTKQLSNINVDLTDIIQNIAETRLKRVDDGIQNVQQVLTKMIKVINKQENRRI